MNIAEGNDMTEPAGLIFAPYWVKLCFGGLAALLVGLWKFIWNTNSKNVAMGKDLESIKEQHKDTVNTVNKMSESMLGLTRIVDKQTVENENSKKSEEELWNKWDKNVDDQKKNVEAQNKTNVMMAQLATRLEASMERRKDER